jgi:2-haloacid dehalogenase
VCVFDAYGTLFDVNSAARRCAEEPGRENFATSWPSISAQWREKQLSYSWILTVLKKYTDFWKITENALDYALDSVGLSSDNELKQRLLKLYLELDAYDEVKGVLSELKEKSIPCAILSNGSKFMLNSAVQSSGIESFIGKVMSVDDVRTFKPDPLVYKMVIDNLLCQKKEVLFISSNGWDIVGAASYGFETMWINRLGVPVDRLPFKPNFIATDLTAAKSRIMQINSENRD